VVAVLVLLILCRRRSRARTGTPDSFSDDPPRALGFCSDRDLADQSLALTVGMMDDRGAGSSHAPLVIRRLSDAANHCL
jgi:hypothetical protein